MVGAIVVYAGPVEEGEQVLAPLRAFGPPIADLVQEMPYTSVQTLVDAAVPAGSRYYWKSSFVDALSSDLGKVLRDGANAAPSPLSMVLLFEIKGAINRVPRDAMAFDHRDHNFEMSIIAQWKSAEMTQSTPNGHAILDGCPALPLFCRVRQPYDGR